jgi:hypothetical protein
MERVQTPFNGITSSSVYQDGDCLDMVNLRKKNGALEPVAPRKKLFDFPYNVRFEHLFIHKNNDYEHWIGVGNIPGGVRQLYYLDSWFPVLIADLDEPVTGMEQTGNVVSILTENRIFYMVFRDGAYIFLGEMPEIPALRMGQEEELTTTANIISDYGYKDGDVWIANFEDMLKSFLWKAMDIAVNGVTFYQGAIEGHGPQLFDACFVRWAFRLYDGTLTKHSPPILVMPARHLFKTKTVNYTFDGSVLRAVEGDEPRVTVYGYRVFFDFDFTYLAPWKDLIRSVDIFMSAPLGITDPKYIREDMALYMDAQHKFYDLFNEIKEESVIRTKECSLFYLVKSIDLSEPPGRIVFPDESLSFGKMDNLILQELMSEDPFSHHHTGAAGSFSYNSRLHLYDIKTRFFDGFDYRFFSWDGDYNYDPLNFSSNSLVGGEVAIEVEIFTGDRTVKVCTIVERGDWPGECSAFISYPDSRATRMTLYYNVSFSGPASWRKAYSFPLTRHRGLNLAYYLEADMQPLRMPDSDPVSAPGPSSAFSLADPSKVKVSALENPFVFPNLNTYVVGDGRILALATNAMPVSDQNYGRHPLFVFATDGVWTLNTGGGETVYDTLSSPTSQETPVSGVVCGTPFGVAFLSRRGLMLISGGRVSFLSPQLEQTPLPIITQTLPPADGVVFPLPAKTFGAYLRDVRLMAYNPHESELILCDPDADYGYVYSFPGESFYRSTERVDVVVKNAWPELYVAEHGSAHDVVRDFGLPDSASARVGLMLRPLRTGTEDIKKLDRMILRGVFCGLDSPAEGKKPVFMVFHSVDGIRFDVTRGVMRDPGTDCRDVDTGLLSRSKFRYFLYAFAGVMDERSRIYFLESVIEKEYFNEKMR